MRMRKIFFMDLSNYTSTLTPDLYYSITLKTLKAVQNIQHHGVIMTISHKRDTSYIISIDS